MSQKEGASTRLSDPIIWTSDSEMTRILWKGEGNPQLKGYIDQINWPLDQEGLKKQLNPKHYPRTPWDKVKNCPISPPQKMTRLDSMEAHLIGSGSWTKVTQLIGSGSWIGNEGYGVFRTSKRIHQYFLIKPRQMPKSIQFLNKLNKMEFIPL